MGPRRTAFSSRGGVSSALEKWASELLRRTYFVDLGRFSHALSELGHPALLTHSDPILKDLVA